VFAIALAGAVYINALHNPFVYDDHRLVADNHTLSGLGSADGVRAIVWHDVTRPVVMLSYAVDRTVWGPAPFGFHVTNVLLHMINVGLFAWLVAAATRAAAGRSIAAPVAALLFAVHPMMTEAVGYISGRSELLAALFFLLGLQAARRAIETRRPRWVAAYAACWLLALGSKETAVLLPLVVCLYDWLIAGSPAGRRQRFVRLHVPFLVIAAALVVARLALFISVEHTGDAAPNWNLIWVELDVLRRYLTLLVAPAGQTIFHAVAPVGPASPRTWLALAVIAGMLALAWRGRRRAPAGAFGVGWFFLLLVPSCVLVLLDRGEPMAEHRVYLASLGVFLTFGVLIEQAARWLAARRTLPRYTVAAAIGAVVLALAGRTVLRNQIWADPLNLWIEAAERAPDHWLPAHMLGEELHRRGQHEQAIVAFRRAIQSRAVESAPHGRLAVCLLEQKDVAGAEAEFSAARRLDASSAEASNGLATVAFIRGDVASARRGYLETLALDPANVAARRGLAVVEEAPGGNPAEALRWCEDIRRLAPGTPGNDECIRRNQERIAGQRGGGS
jgi:tetratricopeptide (TPR) repeat protein